MSARSMRVVVAPDKFKGSLDASAVAAALSAGVRDVFPDAECVVIPMADGGDGTVEAFLAAGAVARRVTVSGPLGDPVEATYARDGTTAIIETAAASGLVLLGDRHAPRRASTRGTGELLRDALDHGARQIILGLGGSATTDGGAGALAALGARFFSSDGVELEPNPEGLSNVARVDLDELDRRVRFGRAEPEVQIAVACDVTSPLLGPLGAAAVFGPQKGATSADVAYLDRVLNRLADAMTAATGRDLRDRPGAGAAGGLGWALASACAALLEGGVRLVAHVRGLPEALAGADLCFTGEGRIDSQTLRGKVVDGVGAFARAAGVPVIAFGGSVERGIEPELRARGILCVPSVTGPATLDEAMRDAGENLRAAAARTCALLTTSRPHAGN